MAAIKKAKATSTSTATSRSASRTSAAASRKPKAVKVQRKSSKHKPPGSSVANKKPLPPPELPQDWPVASRPPNFSADSKALAPGSLLQHHCNGQDIHLSRTAVSRPHLSKEKGKYLLMLPGNLCLQKLSASISSNNNDRNDDNTSNLSQPSTTSLSQDSGNLDLSQPESSSRGADEDDASDDASNDPSAPKSSDNKVTTTSSSLAQLGTILHLSTDEPKLVIPFPDGRNLVFPGKKVETTSKYIMLSCSAKKKGSVACKSIFSSAIVFGQPKWEGEATIPQEQNDVNDVKKKKDDDDRMLLDDQDSDSDNEEKKKTDSFSMVHYGGSQRTIDGVAKGKAAKKPQGPLLVPIHSVQVGKQRANTALNLQDLPNSSLESIVESSDEDESPRDQHKSKPVTLDTSDDADDDDIYGSEDDYGAGKAITPSAPRALPRRRASSQIKKYTPDKGSSSSSSSSDDSDDEAKEPAKPKPIAKKPTPPNKQPQPKKAKPASGKKAESSSISIDDSDDDDNDDIAIVSQPKTASAPKATTKRAKKVNNDVDDEDSDAFSVELVGPAPPKRSTARRQSSVKKKPIYAEEEESDGDFEESSSEANEEGESDGEAAPSKKESVPTRKPKAAPKKVIELSDSSDASESDEEEPEEEPDSDFENEEPKKKTATKPAKRATPTTKTANKADSSKKSPTVAKTTTTASKKISAGKGSASKSPTKPKTATSASKLKPAGKGSAAKDATNDKRATQKQPASGKKRALSSSSILETIHPASDDDDDDDSDSSDNSDVTDMTEKRPNKQNSATKAEPSKKTKLATDTPERSQIKKGDSSVKKSPIGSPFRSRRKKTTESKPTKSPAQRVVNLADDDEFNFGG